ncbi:MAG: catalase [Rhizobacter sp.]
MAAPSTEWVERVQPDEAERHAQASVRFVQMQQAKSTKYGSGRALHRKPVLALRAVLRVLDGLPAHGAHGLFAKPGAHETWVRLSNGSPEVKRDRVPDIRGFSLRVLGVDGPSALGGPALHQDFALINQPAFAFADSKPFVELVMAVAKGPAAVLPWAFKTFGPIGMFAALKRLASTLGVPFTGFATTRFFSAAPISCGPYAVRVRLLPPPDQTPLADPPAQWGDDIKARLMKGPMAYRLQLQFFVDEKRTPIEDASVDWPESLAPYVDVAELVIGPQDFVSSEATAFAEEVERSVFDPWAALAAHKPLGEVMRARKAVYFASQQARGVA